MLLLCFLIGGTHARADHPETYQPRTLNLGILPYTNPTAMFRAWTPFIHHLETHSKIKLAFKTAPDFETFISRTAQGRYDLIITAPHFALLAQRESGYRIIAGLSRGLIGEVLVKKESPYRTLRSLQGKSIATPDRLAIITMMGEQLLKQHGLQAGKDIEFNHTLSHDRAILSLVKGEADAALAVNGLYLRMPERIHSQLRVLAKTQAVTHIMLLANPRLSDEEVIQLRRYVLDLPVTDTHNRRILQYDWGRFTHVSEEAVKRLLPLLPALKTKIH